MHSWRFLLVVVLMNAGFADATVAQRLESLGNGVAWRATQDVPAGSVVGRVLTGAGQPLEGALVQLAGADRVAGFTDADGSFVLTPPHGGDWELRVSMIGYPSTQELIAVPWDAGIFAAVVLQSTAFLCGTVICSGSGCVDLNVRVIDASTGRPPIGEVTLRIEHEDGDVISNTVVLRPGESPYGHLGWGRSIEKEGSYTIEVLADGYRTWRIEGVNLQLVPGCTPKLLNRSHVARLIPID